MTQSDVHQDGYFLFERIQSFDFFIVHLFGIFRITSCNSDGSLAAYILSDMVLNKTLETIFSIYYWKKYIFLKEQFKEKMLNT